MRGRTDIELGPLLGLVGGIVLLVSLFLHWYTPGTSAWNSFEVIDLLLAAAALAAIVTGVYARVDERGLAAAGAVALVLVGSQLINRPPSAQGAGVMFGAWLGLAGAALILAGGIATLAWGISLRVSVDRRPHRAPAPPPPRAAPPPPPPPPPPRSAAATDETNELP